MAHLRQMMLDGRERRNYSPNTVRSYLHAVEEFARHFRRSLEQLGPDHVREYQVHLFRDRKLWARTIAGQTAARRFRVPGKSVLNLMISLCPGCHAKVHRTKVVWTELPPLLLKLWREQHPRAHEQTVLHVRRERQSHPSCRWDSAMRISTENREVRSPGGRHESTDLVDVINENAVLISKLIAAEILLVDTNSKSSVDDRLYSLAMFYRAAILDLETKLASGPVH